MNNPKILYILFQHPHGTSNQAHTAAMERAQQIAKWPGLIRKTWIFDAETQAYGGIYLFEDEASLQAYLKGPVVASMRALPGITNFQTRSFDINTSLSQLTRGLPTP
jgi:hypothetical protein